jgi:galactofuranosylgalactofuranosylrhamnosyl-N-acetylglucosaminyl-diphospho-decaprenol beta-1,5/1,6-galactofuranosyltransferase
MLSMKKTGNTIKTSNNNTVQEIFFSANAAIEALYLRTLHGHAELVDDVLCLEQDTKLSFNTYFNSFYESYWSQISSLDDLCLEIEFSGSLIIEVFRDTHHQGCQRITHLRLDADRQEQRSIPLNALGSSIGVTGRLFVDVMSRKNSRLVSLRFATSSAVRRKARISMGICTFQREKFVLRNLKSLLSMTALESGLARIILVNQGGPLRLPELQRLIDSSARVLLIQQGNLGGCGGFTRTMHEALKIGEVTHHVLMDDDAVLDTRLLQNLISLLSFVDDDVVIGGHMLDMLRPQFLYEAGAQVRDNTRIIPLHHNVDLRSIDALHRFNAFQAVDYNAWWFCTVPIEQIRMAQFPAPIFIRGDDMEYGLRLQEQGNRTVAMPGIAVWHEPFYVKVGGWQLYYDLRNRLILAASYPHRFHMESPLDVLWWMLKSAASHDYLSAALLAKAVKDFLAGPALMEQNSEAIHASVSRLTKSLAQPSTSEHDLPPPPQRLRRLPRSDWGLALLLTWRIASTLLLAGWSRPRLLMDHEASLANIHTGAYVKTNGIRSYRLRYLPDRMRLLQALRSSFSVWLAYRRRRKEAAQQWKNDIARLRSITTWQTIFHTNAPQQPGSTKQPSARG